MDRNRNGARCFRQPGLGERGAVAPGGTGRVRFQPDFDADI